MQPALKVIRESSKTAPEVIRPNDNLELDLGLDSMQRVELLVAIEKELGGDVEESALAEIYTVRQLVDAVRDSAASGKTRTLRPSNPRVGNHFCRRNRPTPKFWLWPGQDGCRSTSCTRSSSRFIFLPTTASSCACRGWKNYPDKDPT